MNVNDSLFTTQFREDGSYSPTTLPVWASLFLAEIEHLFGPRDRSFTILGIDINQTPDEPPYLWFPDSGISPNDVERRSRHIVIRLGPNALSNPIRARWQLAHECVHLLDPWNRRVDGQPSNYLEEGLATWYQNSRVPEAASHEGEYAVAEGLINPTTEALAQAVRRIRLEQRIRIGDMTPDVLLAYCPIISKEVAATLCKRFPS